LSNLSDHAEPTEPTTATMLVSAMSTPAGRMPAMLEAPPGPPESAVCGRCGRALSGSAYELRARNGVARRCLWCALRHRPLVVRSLVISVVVGTVITAINQGNVLVGGALAAELLWKIPLTYTVPYFVSTTAALLGARAPLRRPA